MDSCLISSFVSWLVQIPTTDAFPFKWRGGYGAAATPPAITGSDPSSTAEPQSCHPDGAARLGARRSRPQLAVADFLSWRPGDGRWDQISELSVSDL